MRRAALLAGLIFRSGGLAFTPVSLPSSKDVREQCSETTTRIERDRIRAILWLLIGWHGAELLRFTKPNRYRLHKMRQALEKAD
ncbi:hypothetical protein CBR_g16030 [Chara braunii]|uniref:Secreted protein n=1 Tax=Chara braunii TaxID=69332 RepID=A0A388JT00_CHABU|nr:hypothetical protein CBR_g16030 [Chara braunii]|eukprot:GBG60910.1 hypothetical protein CBR_g16030 [Chara braunii]